MMIDPAVDILVEKAGNKYIACNLMAKRAKNIDNVRGSDLAGQDKKSITLACEEIAAGKVVPSKIKNDDDDTMAF